MRPTRPTVARLLAWWSGLLAAWSCAWWASPLVLGHQPTAAASFAFWTAMKLALWLPLTALALRPRGRADWLGAPRGRTLLIVALAAGWVLLDALAVQLRLQGPHPRTTGWALVNVLLVAPLLEELVFRGVLWSWLQDRAGPWLTLVVSALSFASLHLPGWLAMQGLHAGVLAQLVHTAVLGAFFGLGRRLAGTTWAAMLLHLANNAASAVVL